MTIEETKLNIMKTLYKETFIKKIQEELGSVNYSKKYDCIFKFNNWVIKIELYSRYTTIHIYNKVRNEAEVFSCWNAAFEYIHKILINN